MRVVVVTPPAPTPRAGNRVSAQRWARLLRRLGQRARVTAAYRGEPCEALVVLHARKGHAAARAFRRRYPRGGLVVVLTGTDLYRDLEQSAEARATVAWADRLVTLHPRAVEYLPPEQRGKARCILQSAGPMDAAPGTRRGFAVCVVGHLRPEKDPFRAAAAVRRLPAGSRIRVLHAGAARTPAMARQARAEMRRNPRYRHLGDLPPARVRRLLARCRLMVLSSRMEGGANVISEAVAAGLPVLASRIHSTVGLLGEDYPGYFAVGDTRALRGLLLRAEREPAFLERLAAHLARLAPRFAPEREERAWAALLAELPPAAGAGRPFRQRGMRGSP